MEVYIYDQDTGKWWSDVLGGWTDIAHAEKFCRKYWNNWSTKHRDVYERATSARAGKYYVCYQTGVSGKNCLWQVGDTQRYSTAEEFLEFLRLSFKPIAQSLTAFNQFMSTGMTSVTSEWGAVYLITLLTMPGELNG